MTKNQLAYQQAARAFDRRLLAAFGRDGQADWFLGEDDIPFIHQ